MPRTEKQKEWARLNRDHVREKNNEYQRNNPEKRAKWNKTWYAKSKGIPVSDIKERSKQWHNGDYAKSPHKYMLKYAKARAVKKNLIFDLDLEWCINNTPECCPILGVKMCFLSGNTSPSIDRINPTLGYTKENCWIISSLANKMKWNSTREELLAFCNGVISLEREGRLP